jgi:hypothetical protein
MPHHTSAFQATIANDGNLHQLTSIPDSILPTSGLGLLSNAFAYIMGIYYVGTSITRGQFQAPSLRDYGNLDTQPVNIGTAVESPPRLDDFSMKMIPAAVSEEWDAFAAQNNGSASEVETAILFSSDGNIAPVPPKKIVQIHWSASITLVANVWSLIQMTMAQPLAAGTYAIVGARCLSAGAIAFRFVPSGGPSATTNRPGGVAVQAEDQLDWPRQRRGGWGSWLQFTNVTLPAIEIFSRSADTSEEGDIDIVPL